MIKNPAGSAAVAPNGSCWTIFFGVWIPQHYRQRKALFGVKSLKEESARWCADSLAAARIPRNLSLLCRQGDRGLGNLTLCHLRRISARRG